MSFSGTAMGFHVHAYYKTLESSNYNIFQHILDTKETAGDWEEKQKSKMLLLGPGHLTPNIWFCLQYFLFFLSLHFSKTVEFLFKTKVEDF